MMSIPLVVTLLLMSFRLLLSHSGLMLVNTTLTAKDYSEACLMSVPRMLHAEKNLRLSKGLESVMLRITRQNCKNCRTVSSRDFLDFFVEPIAPAFNELPSGDASLLSHFQLRIESTTQSLKKSLPIFLNSRVGQSMALLTFSSKGTYLGKVDKNVRKKLKAATFAAAFWSVYRHIRDVFVCVGSDADAAQVQALKLPLRRLTIISDPSDPTYNTTHLHRDSMLYTIQRMRASDSLYDGYQYVYFSRGDQILHWRDPSFLFDTIDSSGGTFIAVPHRMQVSSAQYACNLTHHVGQTLTLAQDFPKDLQRKWPKVHAQNIPEVEIAREGIDPTGSCCNDGDVEVAPCKGWWYQCPNYGVRDFPKWLKFGENGLTMPPVTVHRQTCEYNRDRRECPLPPGCDERFPSPGEGMRLTAARMCGEMANVVRLGFADKEVVSR